MNVLYFVVQQTIYSAIPLLIVAIGAVYSGRSGVINIALEGIMVMGVFVGVFFINTFQNKMSGQGPLLLTTLIVGVAGGIFPPLHAFAAISTKADQTVNDAALSMFVPAFTIFTARMTQGVRQIQLSGTFHIDEVPVLEDIPVLGDTFLKNCYTTTYPGILTFITAAPVIKHTRFGLRLWACGERPGVANSVGVNAVKIRYVGVTMSGVLGGIGGLVFVIPTSTNFNASAAGYGFLTTVVLVSGQRGNNKILMMAFFFGIMETLASVYSAMPVLKSLPIPNEVHKMIPYIATLIALAFLSKASQASRAEGVSCDRGSR